MAVHQADLGRPQRQVPVGVRLAVVEQHAARAVHGLDGVLRLVDRGGVHVLAVVGPVPRALPERAVEDDRGLGLDVPGRAVLHAPVVEQRVPDDHALGVEEGHARRLVVEAEEVERLADFAVVASLGLLQEREVGVELLLVEVGGPVDALELGARGVGPPVGAGDLEQLDRLHEPGVRHVRAATEVGELALLVERNGAVLQILDHLELVGLLPVGLQRLGLGHLAAADGELGLDDLLDLGLDAGEILLGDRRHVDVVVEPVLDHRPDGELGLGVKAQDGLGHDVGRTVAHDLERFRVPGGDDPDLRVLLDRGVQVHQAAVQIHRDGVAGQPLGDAQGDVATGNRRFKGLYVAIRKCYADHVFLSWRYAGRSGRRHSAPAEPPQSD